MPPDTYFRCTYAEALKFAEENQFMCTEVEGPNVYGDNGITIRMSDADDLCQWIWSGKDRSHQKGVTLPGSDSKVPAPFDLVIRR